MSQVIIEIGGSYGAGGSSVHSSQGYAVEEITSSGTAQATSINGASGSIVHVENYGAEAIWVRMDGGVAAAGAGRFIQPNGARDFGPLIGPVTVSVINDS